MGKIEFEARVANMGRHNVGFDSHFDTVLLRTPSGSTLTGIIGGERYRATLEHIEVKGPAPDPERYPMCADQPAQVDCRRTDCQFYQGAGKCSNVAPAITLNDNGTCICWSRRRKPEPELKSCPDCGRVPYASAQGLVSCATEGCLLRGLVYPVERWNQRAP